MPPSVTFPRRSRRWRDHHDHIIDQGLCLRCQDAPLIAGLNYCQLCVDELAAHERRQPVAVEASEPNNANEYGDGLPPGHPNRGIEFNPRSWRPK